MCLRLMSTIVLLLILLPARAWSWGPGMGGFHGGFGPPGWRGRPGWHGFPPGWRVGGFFFGGGNPAFVLHERYFFFGGPGGLPPLGAPGFPPGMVLAPPRVFRAPFFCRSHGLEFATKAEFFAHLQHDHGIPPEQAWSRSTVVSSTQIGFFGR